MEETPAINPGETVEPGDSKDLDEELDQRPPTPFEPIPNGERWPEGDKPSLDSFYTVSVYVGNRWGADTSTDLYIIIQGTDGISGKIPLTQEVRTFGAWSTFHLSLFTLCLCPLG